MIEKCKAAMATPYYQGVLAWIDEVPFDECPMEDESDAHEWREGWLNGKYGIGTKNAFSR